MKRFPLRPDRRRSHEGLGGRLGLRLCGIAPRASRSLRAAWATRASFAGTAPVALLATQTARPSMGGAWEFHLPDFIANREVKRVINLKLSMTKVFFLNLWILFSFAILLWCLIFFLYLINSDEMDGLFLYLFVIMGIVSLLFYTVVMFLTSIFLMIASTVFVYRMKIRNYRISYSIDYKTISDSDGRLFSSDDKLDLSFIRRSRLDFIILYRRQDEEEHSQNFDKLNSIITSKSLVMQLFYCIYWRFFLIPTMFIKNRKSFLTEFKSNWPRLKEFG